MKKNFIKTVEIIIFLMIIGLLFTGCNCSNCNGVGSKSTELFFGQSIKTNCSYCNGKGIDISKSMMLAGGSVCFLLVLILYKKGKKKWIYNYNQNIIIVDNTSSITKLFVNGVINDECRGLQTIVTLQGKLDTGEVVKATLGGIFIIGCSLFIDNKLQTPQQ